MLKITKALVASSIIAGAVFAAPLAANAAPVYTPPTNAPAVPAASSTVAPSGHFTVAFPDGTFTPLHAVEATFSSAGAVPAGNATFLAATSTLRTTSTKTGAATFTGTLPAGAVGAITVQATDGVHSAAATITVAAPTGLARTASSDPSLATTGTYISLATIWGAVGLVAVGGGFIAIRTMARRKSAGAHAA
jgi:hypothetical protein